MLVDNIAMLYDKGKINAALIIAPKGVYRNWFSGEIPNHLASHIDYKSVLWTATTSKTKDKDCLLYTSPSPRDGLLSRMPSSA